MKPQCPCQKLRCQLTYFFFCQPHEFHNVTIPRTLHGKDSNTWKGKKEKKRKEKKRKRGISAPQIYRFLHKISVPTKRSLICAPNRFWRWNLRPCLPACRATDSPIKYQNIPLQIYPKASSKRNLKKKTFSLTGKMDRRIVFFPTVGLVISQGVSVISHKSHTYRAKAPPPLTLGCF